MACRTETEFRRRIEKKKRNAIARYEIRSTRFLKKLRFGKKCTGYIVVSIKTIRTSCITRNARTNQLKYPVFFNRITN